MIRRALLIANPASRRGKALLEVARRAFASAGVVCDVAFTEHAGHARTIAAEHHADYDAVFALGGDGTAMEVAGALAGTTSVVGVLPGGTGNLLARALNIPMGIDRAVRALLAGHPRAVDMGRLADGRHFCIAAGVGIDTRMVQATPAWLKRRFGMLAYTLVGTRVAIGMIVRGERLAIRLTTDGVMETISATTVMVANFGSLVSGRLTLGPDISPDDGQLDVCIFTPRSLLDALWIMWRMLRADFSHHPSIVYRRGGHIRIETDSPVAAQADGELIGLTPLDISVDHRAVQLLVP